jgi:hypothetical protein
MRTIGTVLLAFAALLAPAQQPATSDLVSSDKLSIPAQLSKTVRADKAHSGDPVELRTLEAVLVSKDLVMPANTLLHGRVLSASPKQEGKNSWLAFVVEGATWKQHSLPLHAFFFAQITMPQRAGDLGGMTSSPQPQSVRMRTPNPNRTYITNAQQNAMTTGRDPLGANHTSSLENVSMMRDKDGTAYLVSSKTNVKLPAGLMLMLRNETAGSSETEDAKTATSASGSERQP